jgi:hypothetical protein
MVCFNFLVNALFLTLVVNLFHLGHLVDETVLTAIFLTTNIYFLFRSSYTFYDQRGVGLLVKSLLMLVVLKVALEAYRALLFYITMASL